MKPCVGSSRSKVSVVAAPRGERAVECETTHADLLVVGDEPGRHAELETVDDDVLACCERQFERRDRLAAPVLQPVVTTHADTLLEREEIDVEHHRGDLRLRLGLGRLVLLLVVDLALLPAGRGLVVVEDVGVPEDERADRDEDGGRAGRQAARAGVDPRASLDPALAPRARRAAGPEQVGDDQQEHRRGAPVRLERSHPRQEVAVAVDVGVRRARHAAELVEVVLEAEPAREQQRRVVDDHQEVAEVLVVDDRVHRDRQGADQPVADQVDGQEVVEIEADLEVRVALRGLDRHAAQHQAELQHQRHEHQRHQLGDQRQPGRRRQGVADLVEAVVALAPDELAGIERDDDEHERREAARDQAEQLEGDRPGGGAVDVAGGRAREHEEEQAGQHQHAEVDVLGRLAELEPGTVRHQAPAARRPDGRAAVRRGTERAHLRRHGTGLRRRGRIDDRLATPLRRRAGVLREREAPVAERRDQHGDAEPEQPVPEQDARERHQPEVAFGNCPVFGEPAHRAHAQRIDQRREIAVVGVLGELLRDQPPEDDEDAADVDRQHLARGRGEREEDGADEDGVRQQDGRERREIGRPVRGAETVRIHARQLRRQVRTEDEAGEDDEHGAQRTEESATEIGRLVDRRREEEALRPVLDILLDGPAHDRRHHRDAEESQDGDGLGQGVRRIHHHLAAAEHDVGVLEETAHRSDPQQREREEDGEVDPGREQLEPRAELERRDAEEAHRCPPMATKYASSSVGSTRVKPGPGRVSAMTCTVVLPV